MSFPFYSSDANNDFNKPNTHKNLNSFSDSNPSLNDTPPITAVEAYAFLANNSYLQALDAELEAQHPVMEHFFGESTITLKNGKHANRDATENLLNDLYETIKNSGQTGLRELVTLTKVCRSPHWQQVTLKHLECMIDEGVLDHDGIITPFVRDVVVSSVRGNTAENLYVVSPLATVPEEFDDNLEMI